MTRITWLILTACSLALAQTSCMVHSANETAPEKIAPLEGYRDLDRFPFKEAWYGMYFKEDKIGYSHFKIEPSGENFSLTTDARMRLVTKKKTNEIQMKERVSLRPDLTFMGFQSVVRKNGEEERMAGKTEKNQLILQIKSGGRTESREIPMQGEVFYQQTISLMPALKGLRDGASYSFSVFNPAIGKVEKVQQQLFLVRGAPGPKGAVWKVRTGIGESGNSSQKTGPQQYKASLSENMEQVHISSWLDKQGLTVLEENRDGSLITLLEDKSVADSFSSGNESEKELTLE